MKAAVVTKNINTNKNKSVRLHLLGQHIFRCLQLHASHHDKLWYEVPGDAITHGRQHNWMQCWGGTEIFLDVKKAKKMSAVVSWGK